MRRVLWIALLFTTFSAHALQSLRVGSQVLVVGDSAARVQELLGRPSVRARGSAGKSKKRKGAVATHQNDWKAGERWQYRHEGHTITFFIVDGKIAHIEDTAR